MTKYEFPTNVKSQQVRDLLEMYSSGLDFRDEKDVKRYTNILLSYFNGIKAFESKIVEVVTTFTRARLNDGPGFYFKNIKEMKYPPVEKARINRANLPGEPILYCSDDPGTTLFEVRPQKVGDWITSIEIDVPVKVVDLLVLGVELDDRLGSGLSEIEKGVHTFLREKFSAKVHPDESHLYHLTIAFINLYIGDKHGVMYPSVASNLKGRNIALKTDFVDKYGMFGVATIHEVTAMKSDYNMEVKCVYRSLELKENGDFIWEPVTGCTGHSINESIYD